MDVATPTSSPTSSSPNSPQKMGTANEKLANPEPRDVEMEAGLSGHEKMIDNQEEEDMTDQLG